MHKISTLGSPPAWDRVGTTLCSATAAAPTAAFCSDTAGHTAQHKPIPEAPEQYDGYGGASPVTAQRPTDWLSANRREVEEVDRNGAHASAPWQPDVGPGSCLIALASRGSASHASRRRVKPGGTCGAVEVVVGVLLPQQL